MGSHRQGAFADCDFCYDLIHSTVTPLPKHKRRILPTTWAFFAGYVTALGVMFITNIIWGA